MKAFKNQPPVIGTGSDMVAPDCHGMNFFLADEAFRGILNLYMEPALRDHLWPHLARLGELAGAVLDDLARSADRHPPILHPRDRFGHDEDWIEYHPAYREMERIAFGEFGLHAMMHRGGVLGWPHPMPPIAKYAFQYLFVQAEFGLMCPVSLTDTSIYVLSRYGSDELKQKLLPRMLSQDVERMWKGTQFMTEKAGGSDVGAIETVARNESGQWRLYGDKWFCSHADADVALLLARPEGAPPGTRGLGLFAMPRRMENGTRNCYRIVRLKDKLGTKSMASGETKLEGAFAWGVGDIKNGLKQILDQVNLSRLSHGVRAAGMMRRCLNESLCVARSRIAFGHRIIEMPLVRRQLMKIMVPTEQALSMYAYVANVMEHAEHGDQAARTLLRLLTPVYKFRACRDNIAVATGAMEMRGGNGYIEDWVNARLVRDAQVGLLWEGTSNINALDAITRAVAKSRAHEALSESLRRKLDEASGVPERYARNLSGILDRACAFAWEVASSPGSDRFARLATGALYNVASAILMACEGTRLGDGRRLLLSRMVLEHRLVAKDPMRPRDDSWEAGAAELLLGDGQVRVADAMALLG